LKVVGAAAKNCPLPTEKQMIMWMKMFQVQLHLNYFYCVELCVNTFALHYKSKEISVSVVHFVIESFSSLPYSQLLHHQHPHQLKS
jgi:hypothetical protein